jgi:hypothetical protein
MKNFMALAVVALFAAFAHAQEKDERAARPAPESKGEAKPKAEARAEPGRETKADARGDPAKGDALPLPDKERAQLDQGLKSFAEDLRRQLTELGKKLAEDIKKELTPEVQQSLKKAVEEMQKATKKPKVEEKPAPAEKTKDPPK